MLLDVNVLVYWIDDASPHGDVVRRLLRNAALRGERVGIPWLTLLGFLRVVTNQTWSRVEPSVGFDAALWLTKQPNVWAPEPGPGHAELLVGLARRHTLSGGGLTDAYLAALAIQHDLTLVSFDRGFAKFDEVRWFNPAADLK